MAASDMGERERHEVEMLAQELGYVLGQDLSDCKDRNALLKATHRLEGAEIPSGLCLSGGGIRSATFCLGVLQGLARVGRLAHFHYLSTVSGGGYAGAWLNAWIRRSSLATVVDELAGEPPVNATSGTHRPARAKDPVARLRAYSNFLAPVQGLSGDILALVGTFARNLFLHWLVVLPLLVAGVLLPRIQVAVLGWADPPAALLPICLAVVALGLLTTVAYMASDLPPDDPLVGPRDRFLGACLAPLVLAALALSWLFAWIPEGNLQTMSFWSAGVMAGIGAGLHLAGAVVGAGMRFWRRTGTRGIGTLASASWTVVAVLGSGAIGGLLVYAAAKAGYDWRSQPESPRMWREIYAIFAVPILATIFWLAVTLNAGITRRWRSEDDREWWARAGGIMLAFVAAWVMLSTLVIYGPRWFFAIPLPNETSPAGALGGGALLLGMLSGLWGYWSKNGAALTQHAVGLASRLGMRVLDLAAIAFLVLLVMLVSLGVSATLERFGSGDLKRAVACELGGVTLAHQKSVICSLPCPAPSRHDGCPSRTPQPPAGELAKAAFTATLVGADPGALAAAAILLIALGLGTAWFIGANAFSLHSMYCNRLARAYLGASRPSNDEAVRISDSNEDGPRRPHWFTGFDPDDNLSLAEIGRTRTGSRGHLFPVINAALNLLAPAGERLEWQQRKAAAFTFTPLHCGSDVTGYAPTQRYGKKIGGLSLARAMAVSGAAASPSMGFHSSTPVAMVMSFFNARLGWWMPNPNRNNEQHWPLDEPPYGLDHILAEATGRTTDRSRFVHLSDGGHFENLGLYEMVRRRCRRIVLVDASQDPEYRYEDLARSLRSIRIDFGVTIEFRHGLPTPKSARDTGCHFAIGRIRYAERDRTAGGRDGKILYIKPVLSGDEPLDLQAYAESSRRGTSVFPHQSTVDQFFDEAQFESYRLLGLHSVLSTYGADGRSRRRRRPLHGPSGGGLPPAPVPVPDAGHHGDLQKGFSSLGDLTKASLVAAGTAAVVVTGTVTLSNPTLDLSEPARATLAQGNASVAVAADKIASAAAGVEVAASAVSGALTGKPLQSLSAAVSDVATALGAASSAPAAGLGAGAAKVSGEDPASLLAAIRELSGRIGSAKPGSAAGGDLSSELKHVAERMNALNDRMKNLGSEIPGSGLLGELGKAIGDLRRAVSELTRKIPQPPFGPASGPTVDLDPDAKAMLNRIEVHLEGINKSVSALAPRKNVRSATEGGR